MTLAIFWIRFLVSPMRHWLLTPKPAVSIQLSHSFITILGCYFSDREDSQKQLFHTKKRSDSTLTIATLDITWLTAIRRLVSMTKRSIRGRNFWTWYRMARTR